MSDFSSVVISAMLPIRNEEMQIEKTIKNLEELEFKGKLYVVVVNDGSNDNTLSIARKLTKHVIDLEDRGFSALGRPELSVTHNAGFEYILRELPDTDYILVVGGDTTFDSDYVSNLLDRFSENTNLMIAGGKMKEETGRIDDVRGSGRLLKKSLLVEAGGKLPFSYAWEPYLVQYAKFKGFDVQSFFELNMYTARKSLTLVNWSNYGIGMKEMGYYWPYAIGRGILQILKGHPINGLKLISGFLFGTPSESYPVEIRRFTRDDQKKKIKKIFFRK